MAHKKSIGAEMVARRYAKMTPQQRSDSARRAARARWERLSPEERTRANKAVWETRRKRTQKKRKVV